MASLSADPQVDRRAVAMDPARQRDAVGSAVRYVLRHLGEDPTREGLADTPCRFIEALREMTRGVEIDTAAMLRAARFHERADEMIALCRVPFYSLCEHHLMPFHGTASVAYLPGKDGLVVGLSKMARLVDAHARRLQLQERMTREIAGDMMQALDPQGVGVIVRAHHTCMGARGIKARGEMVTSSLLGLFREPQVRREFFALDRETD